MSFLCWYCCDDHTQLELFGGFSTQMILTLAREGIKLQ